MPDRVTEPRQGLANVLVPVAAILAILMLAKFIIIKPVAFLGLALLFGVSAYLLRKGARAGIIMLLVLGILTAGIFGAHLLDKGFSSGEYQNTTDFIVVVLGFPLALVAVAGTVAGLWGHSRRPAPR